MEPADAAQAAHHESAEVSTSSTPTATATAAHQSPARVWAIALAFGLAAGILSWIIGEFTLNAFRPRLFTVTVLTQTFVQPTTESMNIANRKNAILGFAIFGSVVGLAMGIAGGIASRSVARGITAGLGGVAVGATVATLASILLLRLYYRGHVPDPNDLLTPIMVHGGIWAAIGAVGGLAYGVSVGAGRRLPQAIEGACVGAFFATVLFHLICGVFFPESRFAEPIGGESLIRLLSRLLVSVLIAVGAARGAQGRVVRPKKPTTLALGD